MSNLLFIAKLTLHAQAQIFYRRGNYNLALKSYQQALTLSPNGKPDPRIGIAQCYNKLKMLNESKAVYKRILSRVCILCKTFFWKKPILTLLLFIKDSE